MAKVTNEIMIENAEIRFRNFGGVKDQYNPNGKRSFVVLLNPDDAVGLERKVSEAARRRRRTSPVSQCRGKVWCSSSGNYSH